MAPDFDTFLEIARALALVIDSDICQVILADRKGRPKLVLPVTHSGDQEAPSGSKGEVPEEKGRPLSPVALDILTILEEAGKPLTTFAILAAMARHKPVMEWSQRSVAGYLAAMVRDGMLLNPEGAKPPGYRLPE